MWQYVLTLVILVACLPFIVIMYKLQVSKKKLKGYQDQGLRTMNFPVAGWFSLYSRDHPENKKGSNIGRLISEIRKDPYAPAIVFNRVGSPGCALQLLNIEYIKEYYTKEDMFSKVPHEKNTEWLMSFYFYDNQKAAKCKLIFSNLFHYSNLVKFTPMMFDMITEETQKMIASKSINSESFTRINLEEYFDPIFDRILSIILFGDKEVAVDKSGKSISRLCMSWLKFIPIIRSHILYVLFPDLTSRFNILDSQKQVLSINKEISEILQKKYKEKQNKKDLGNSAFDHIINHNNNCIKEGNNEDYLDDKAVLGIVNLLQIAGNDTSSSTSVQSLCFAAQHPEHQKVFEDINTRMYDTDGNIDVDSIDSDKPLDLWVKEALRMFNPTNKLTPRVALQDVKLKDLLIKKDDTVQVSLAFTRFNELVFKDSNHFDMKRFEKTMDKDVERYAYNPFSQGKRACMGKHLGELMIKLMLTQFMKHFELRKPDDIEYYTDCMFMTHETNPVVEVRLKSKQVSK